MVEYIEDNINSIPYEVTAELAVIYASKMNTTYKNVFFTKMKAKFLKELKYLKEDTFYKILWSLLKAEQLKVACDSPDWEIVKDIIKTRSKEFTPKIISDILLLSTMEGV